MIFMTSTRWRPFETRRLAPMLVCGEGGRRPEKPLRLTVHAQPFSPGAAKRPHIAHYLLPVSLTGVAPRETARLSSRTARFGAYAPSRADTLRPYQCSPPVPNRIERSASGEIPIGRPSASTVPIE